MMERLAELKYDITKLDAKIENMQERINKMAFDDKTEVGIKFLASTVSYLKELREYKQLEEQGLLLRLPCKVGDILYVNGILGVGEAEEYKVIRVDYHSNLATKRSEFYIEALLVSDPRNSIGFYDKEIGKTVFLTKEEAEQKLKEMESD